MNYKKIAQNWFLGNLRTNRKSCERNSSGRWRVLKIGAIVVGTVVLAILTSITILIFHKTALPTSHFDPAAARRLQSELQDAANSPGGFLSADETEINSILHPYLERASASPRPAESTHVQDIKIKLKDDRMHVYLVLDFHGQAMTVDFESKVYAENGYARFVPTAARIGSLPIPRSTLEAAAHRMMESPETREQLRLPTNISDLRVQDGKIRVIYR